MLYTPHQPAPFDAECGTFEASAYEGGCSGASMLCGEGAEQGSLFVRCLRAINCKMKSEMRVDAEQDELAGSVDGAAADMNGFLADLSSVIELAADGALDAPKGHNLFSECY